jgi:multiple sugar transport system ATP-binding protein
MAKLTLQNLTKKFDKLCAVDNLSLEVEDGEFIVVLGPSGAGKTTTLKLIAGVETPTSGRVYIGDKLMNAIEPHHRNVAMAFESYALYPHLNVKENLAFPLRAPGRKFSSDEIVRRVTGVAETLNIHMLLDRLPQHLSNGQKQRVALGRAMVREPDVLLLDEPISHLDAKLRHRMRTEFKALEAAIRYTTIYVTHDYLEAMSLGDRLVVLNQGQIQQIGKPQEVFDNPANVFVAQILGYPQINLIPCRLRRDGEALQLISKDGSLSVDAPPHLAAILAGRDSEHYTLGVRPMHLKVIADPVGNGDSAAAANTSRGTVYVFERLGTKGVLTVTVGQQKLDLITPIELSFQIDEILRIGVDPDSIMIFDSQTQQNVLFA